MRQNKESNQPDPSSSFHPIYTHCRADPCRKRKTSQLLPSHAGYYSPSPQTTGGPYIDFAIRPKATSLTPHWIIALTLTQGTFPLALVFSLETFPSKH